MRIIQVLPTLAFGDAVSNHTRATERILKERGYDTAIYAEHIDNRLPEGAAIPVEKLNHLQDNDVLIYQASTGSQLNYSVPQYGGKQVMVYHNITPPDFFHGYNDEAEENMRFGYSGIQHLADKMQYCVADSEYNRQQLIQMGYTCPIDVCPILISFEDYDRVPNQDILDQYRNDGITNLLFVGRISPNKKQEDIIQAFYCYQKKYNSKSRLFLVGNSGGMERYERRLRQYAEILGISDQVVFPGHISFDAVLSYYQLADVFVCMSEHEGFCVPLLEAMHFDLPIVAYKSTAVTETLGTGGLLFEEKDPWVFAAAISHLVNDNLLRAYISSEQKKRLEYFSYISVKQQLISCIDKIKNA